MQNAGAALVVISGSEDLSAAPDIPVHKEIFTYQKELIDTAKRSGVDNLLIIGPSGNPEHAILISISVFSTRGPVLTFQIAIADDAPGGQASIAATIKEQIKLTQKMGLETHAQQFVQVVLMVKDHLKFQAKF